MQLASAIRTGWAMIGPARPIILYHKPTARCDCRCQFCDFWKHPPAGDDVLPSAQILSLIARARAAGMTFYTAWGGEPLLAEHLPEWLARARGLGMMTTVCTAGLRLPDRAAEIAPHTDQLLLSLEAVGDAQDELRRTPGLFARAAAGLDEFNKRGPGRVIIWSNVTRGNADQVEAVARFAREHGATVEYFPAARYPGYNEDLVLDARERDEVFGRIIALKREGLPVNNTSYALELMRSGRPFCCNLARLAVQVDAAGRVWPCEPRVFTGLKPYGTISDLDLAGLPRHPEYRRQVKALASCNACLLPCVAHMADNLVLQAMRRWIENQGSRGRK